MVRAGKIGSLDALDCHFEAKYAAICFVFVFGQKGFSSFGDFHDGRNAQKFYGMITSRKCTNNSVKYVH